MDEKENIFKDKLKQQIQILKNCQKKEQVDSCLKCKKLLEFEVRINYVRSVYESMSKGEVGGFEF